MHPAKRGRRKIRRKTETMDELVGKDVIVTFKGSGSVRCGKLRLSNREGLYVLERYMGRALCFTEKSVEDIREADGKALKKEFSTLLKGGCFSVDFSFEELVYFSAGAAYAVRYLSERLAEADGTLTRQGWEDEALAAGEKRAKRFLRAKYGKCDGSGDR